MTDEQATPGGATMPEELAEILREPGWSISRESCSHSGCVTTWSHQFGQAFVNVTWDSVTGDLLWDVHTVNRWGHLKPFEVYGAAELMQHIERAIAGRGAEEASGAHDCDREYRRDCASCNGVNPGDVGTW